MDIKESRHEDRERHQKEEVHDGNEKENEHERVSQGGEAYRFFDLN